MSESDDAVPSVPVEWFSRLAHDLRNPLGSLRLRAELELPENAAAAWFADIDAATRIVEQHGLYARLAHRFDIGGPASLASVLEHLGNEEEPHWTVDADGVDLGAQRLPGRAVEVMLRNLLDNAASHGRGPVSLVVRVTPGPPVALRIVVRDAGAGLAAGELASAMQPFVCLQPSGQVRAGLGLAIVERLAARLGGRVVHEPHDGRRWGVGVQLPS